jgi:hypothetical protein
MSAAAAAPQISVSKNVATISFTPNWATAVEAEVNFKSSLDHYIELQLDDSASQTVTGTGDQASIETIPVPEGTSKLVATFCYGKDKKPSELQHGAPWNLGNMQLLMVLAENEDDGVFDDVVLQVRGVVGLGDVGNVEVSVGM